MRFLNLLGDRFFGVLLSVLVGQPINISRFADAWLLFRMSALAAERLFFAA
jgi:ABC-type amino acid transport system permease subunit